ncbi:MAG: hypothetical protein RLZZ206_3634 [Cyanobacteriota bacterium]
MLTQTCEADVGGVSCSSHVELHPGHVALLGGHSQSLNHQSQGAFSSSSD